LQQAINGTPAGGTLRIPASSTPYVIRTGLVIVRAITIEAAGVTIQAASGTGILDLILATDVDGITVNGLTFDGNHTARNGFSGIARRRSPSGLALLGCGAMRMAQDPTLTYGGFRVASGDAGASKRYENVKLERCRAQSNGTLGASLAYADGVAVTDWDADDQANHGIEFIGCRQVTGELLKGSRCGGSGIAIGDHSSHFTLNNISVDTCAGDGAISVENTCAYGKVANWQAINCPKPAVSVNYGTPGPPPTDVIRAIEVSTGTAKAMAPRTVTNVTRDDPAVVTSVGHGFRSIGNTILVAFAGVVGMTQLNGGAYYITVLDANHFTLQRTLGVNLDSRKFGAYVSGGSVSIQTPGLNIYGGIPAYGQAIVAQNIDIDGFNGGVAMAYLKGSTCKDIRVTRLRGPGSYVAKFTAFRQGGKVINVSCLDSTTADAAFQFLNLGVSNCDDVAIDQVQARQSGAGGSKPLIYVEGSGSFYITKPRTAAARNFIGVRRGDSPVITVHAPQGSVSSGTVGGDGTPHVLELAQAWEGLTDRAQIDRGRW
jgi:hypothetical protein